MVFRETLNKLRDLGKWEELVTSATTFLEEDPGSSFGLRALEQAFGRLGRTDEQAETWRRLVEEADEHYPFAARYAEHLKAKGDEESARDYLWTALTAAIDEKAWDEAESHWMSLCESSPRPLSRFLSAAEDLHGKSQTERAGILLQMLVPHYQALNDPQQEYQLVTRIGGYLPIDRDARQAVGRWYRTHHADRPDLEELLDRTGLLSFTPIPEALEKLEYYLRFSQGQIFLHTDWGAGVVTRLDMIRQRIEIDFERKRGHSVTLELAERVLLRLDRDDWRVLKAFNPEEGRRLMDEAPVSLIVSVLKSFNGKANARELKERLLRYPLTESRWSKWWADTQKLLKEDPHIAITGASVKVFAIREKPLTYEDEIRLRFERARGLEACMKVFAEYADHVRDQEGDFDLLRELGTKTFQCDVSREKPGAVVAVLLQMQGILRRNRNLEVEPPFALEAWLGNFQTACNVLCTLESTDHQQRWLERMQDAFADEWEALLQRMFPDPRIPLRDTLADQLEQRGQVDFIRGVYQEVAANTRDQYVVFTWFILRVLPDPARADLYGIKRSSLLRQSFLALDYLSMKSRSLDKDEAAEMRKYASAIRDILRRNEFAVIKDVIGGEDAAFARALHRTVDSTAGLESRMQDRIVNLIEARFPDIFAPVADPSDAKKRITYCLRESLERLRAELKTILEVEVPQNARDIDTARRHGDLSENAEYKAAKERQALLQVRSGELQQQIRTAHVPDLGGVTTEKVGFGTRIRVRCLDEGDAERDYVILGPWESDPERGIISYQAALGSAFLDKGAGETIEAELPTGARRFAILEIQPAFPDRIRVNN